MFGRVGRPGASAFDGTGDDAALSGFRIGPHAEKQLGGIGDQGVIAVVQVRAVGGAGFALQPLVDLMRRLSERRGETLGEIHLEDVAGGDVVDRSLHGAFVSGAGEVGG